MSDYFICVVCGRLIEVPTPDDNESDEAGGRDFGFVFSHVMTCDRCAAQRGGGDA